ncbi:MAG: hypothetical protein A2W00_12230 [Candidatus Eisenbacteria bacterium RBG_16_71_46]|nr:MAG: hypothetical protein A2W00_12230 [Candidatus Eisenbacteria bacterium RBG_16_71_46]OGF22728.1 MAG: hypothetical protein A2V63_04840 [Candidatus Eisenbacteria bacterium RBG_19FT_COMBO_70_11]
MRYESIHRTASLLFAAAMIGGCSSGPAPRSAQPPPSPLPQVSPETGFSRIVSGASDSVGSQLGSPDALYRYGFRQILPGSDRFTFQDRDLSFYFRPSPDALFIQIENRQDLPIWIDWDRSTFDDPIGGSSRLAHSSTRWQDRYGNQTPTQIPGLQRYTDYLLPMDYLVDPAGRSEQLHRPLFPEDAAAIQFADREFGVNLSFRIEDKPRTYTFRFKVASVLPR